MSAAPRKKTANMQSSIKAWLQKPAVTKPSPQNPHDTNSAALPTPPLEHSATPSKPEFTQNTLPPVIQHVHKPGPFALPPLPANVELVPLTEELMHAFKRLTSLTLPIAYPPIFFAESMEEPNHGVTLMALWHPEPPNSDPSSRSEKPRLIGAIRCRILPASTLYLSTLGLLSPYRSYGIATHLLQRIIAKASKEHGVKCVTAHVWEANEDGLEWYKKRGFEIIGKEERYYTKLKPSGAVLMRKWIGVADILGDTNAPAVLDE